MPRCLVIQHVPAEGPFAVGRALVGAGVELDGRRVFAGEPLPDGLDGLDGVVVMGGPMSAATDQGFPTRQAELDLLAHGLEQDLPLLGICLGAQLLAVAAGGRVTTGSAGPEIGWAPIELTPAAGTDPLLQDLPVRLEVLHWHADTFSLPDGAVHLATSAHYPGQAFRMGPRAWGLQFHLEVDRPAVSGFLAAFDQEVRAAGLEPGAIEQATDPALARLAPIRDRVTTRFARMVAGRDALSSAPTR